MKPRTDTFANHICLDCLGHFDYLCEDKGAFICNNCFHMRYTKRKFTNQNHVMHNPTMDDLKKHLEQRIWKR